MPRPKRPMLQPVAKLAKMVAEKGAIEAGESKALTVRKADYLAQFEEGGDKRDWFLNAKALTVVTDRVHYIAQLMATGMWQTPMATVLARAWEVSPQKLRQYREEAGRLLEMSLGDIGILKNTALAFLERVAHDAIENGDRRSAVTAIRTFAEIGGLIKNQTEITGPDGGPLQILAAVKSMTDEELQAEIAKAAEKRIAETKILTEPPPEGVTVDGVIDDE